MKCAFIVPFDHATQSPVLPTDKNGNSTWRSWGRKSQPMGDSILVEIEAAELILAPLKLDTKVQWLEDYAPPKVAPMPIGMTVEPEKESDFIEMEEALDAAIDTETAKIANPLPVKAFLRVQTKVSAAAITKQVWNSPDKIVESVAKLHGQTPENYRNSGLG
jgi:hypothetical protein